MTESPIKGSFEELQIKLPKQLMIRCNRKKRNEAKNNCLMDSGNTCKKPSIKVGDKSLIIKKSAYHLLSLLISKRGFSSLKTRKTFGKILSGNYRFLIPIIRVTTHNCAYLLH